MCDEVRDAVVDGRDIGVALAGGFHCAQILPGRAEYVVTTSEFLKIKALLKQHENRLANEDENRPSLKRKTHGSDGDPSRICGFRRLG